MQVDVASRPAYAIAYVRLEADESVVAEAGSMVALSAGVQAAPAMPGGAVRSVVRHLVAQESLLMTRFTSRVHGGWVSLSPRFPGDITTLDVLAGADICVQSGSLLAHGEGVDASAAIGSLQTLALREGATVLRLSGNDTAVLAAYGGLERFDLQSGQELVVDSGHLVAWSADMSLRVGPLRGLVTAALSGEGIVGQFTGPGTVFVQTRAEQQFRSWVFPDRGHDRGR